MNQIHLRTSRIFKLLRLLILEDIGDVRRLPAVARKQEQNNITNSLVHNLKREVRPLSAVNFPSSYPGSDV